MDNVSLYILVGLIWCFIADNFMTTMESNWTRFRFILFWPITLGAFLLGIVGFFINDEE